MPDRRALRVQGCPMCPLATLSVFDLDTSSDGQYIEQITVHDYEYFKTPLRASSGADVTT